MKPTLKNYLLICITALAVVNLISCYPTGPASSPYIIAESRQKENIYYAVSAANTPLHTKKGDMNFNLMGTSDSKISGGDVQASFMAGNHVGIIGSYSFAGNKDDNTDYVKFNRFELGSGFVTQLSKNWHLETYAGFGNGKISNAHATGISKINHSHIFLQPAIAVSDHTKKIQFGFVSKFSGIKFNVKDTSFTTDREPFSTKHLKSLYNKPFHIMWEPGVVFRAGWKNFQFQTGYSLSTDLTNPDLYKAGGNFSFGFSFRLNTLNK